MSAPANGSSAAAEVRNGYTIPKWAGKPPNGLHLDVMKEGKLIQKLMIDEKRYYFFGRNKDLCDFTIDHASCSRVHAVLLWHKHLNRSFIVDLGSAHFTFIGHVQLEANKPQQVFVDSELHFGASTRSYIIRERPQTQQQTQQQLQQQQSEEIIAMDEDNSDKNGTSRYTLPQSEAELDNLTEFNTAHNKRIAQLDVGTAAGNSAPAMPKKKRKAITFAEDEIIINPEDVDPSVGRFRNLIQTTIVIPNKKKRPFQSQSQAPKRTRDDDDAMMDQEDDTRNNESSFSTLYDDEFESSFTGNNSIASNLGIRMLDLAPDVESNDNNDSNDRKRQLEMLNRQHLQNIYNQQQMEPQFTIDAESHKKKYVKEAWPGRKPGAPVGLSEFTSPLNQPAMNAKLTTTPLQRQLSNPVKSLESVAAFNPPPPPQQQQQSSTTKGLNPPKRLII